LLKIIFILSLITFIPTLELRASIPVGVLFLNLNWILVFAICWIVNVLLGFIVFYFIEHIVALAVRIPLLNRFYAYYVARVQKKISKNVDKYGSLGVAVFIGIPLPGSGVYSGALAAYLIGMNFRKFILPNIIGVTIAAIAVTAIVMTGNESFKIFLKESPWLMEWVRGFIQ